VANAFATAGFIVTHLCEQSKKHRWRSGVNLTVWLGVFVGICRSWTCWVNIGPIGMWVIVLLYILTRRRNSSKKEDYTAEWIAVALREAESWMTVMTRKTTTDT